MKAVPKTLCSELIELTVAYKYATALLRNDRVKRYLLKYHPEDLRQLEELLDELISSALEDSSPHTAVLSRFSAKILN